MNIYYACVYGHLMGAGWGTFFWKFCWNPDLTSVSHPHSVHTAQRKWVSRMMSWLQQKCHPLIYSLTFNHSFFKMRRVCVCVCVCTRHAMINQSLVQWQQRSFLCISFEFNRADSQVHRVSAHSVRRARMGETQSAKAAQWGTSNPERRTPSLHKENP